MRIPKGGSLPGGAWTPERSEQLRELWESGQPASEIAKEMGTTKNAIVGKAHRLGLKGRPSPIGPPLSAEERAKRALTDPAARSAALARATVEPRVTEAEVTPARPTYPGGFRSCQWIEGSPTRDDTCKCGRPVVPGSRWPYCPEHLRLATTRATVKSREAA